jgi:hypothetical protein
VDHPDVVENYRAAHGISLASDHGQATTEDLRQAMVHYRSLFDTLLGAPQGMPQAPSNGGFPSSATTNQEAGATAPPSESSTQT